MMNSVMISSVNILTIITVWSVNKRLSGNQLDNRQNCYGIFSSIMTFIPYIAQGGLEI